MTQQITLSSQILGVLKSIQGMSAAATTGSAAAAQQQTQQQNKKTSNSILGKIGSGAATAGKSVLGRVLGVGGAIVGGIAAAGYAAHLKLNQPNEGKVQAPGFFPSEGEGGGVGAGVDRPPPLSNGMPGSPNYGRKYSSTDQTGDSTNPNPEQFSSPIPPHMRGRMSEGIKTPEGKAIDRSQFDEQMKNPEVRAALAARAQIEVGGQPDAQRKWMESVFNRAYHDYNGDIMKAIDNHKNSKGKGYYPNKDDDRWEEMRKLAPSKNWEKHIDDVHKKGTNDARGGTGNESGTVQSDGAPIVASGGGERTVIENWHKNKTLPFRDLTPEEKAAQAKQAESKRVAGADGLYHPIDSQELSGRPGGRSASRGAGQHQGVDMMAKVGTPVYSPKDGQVTKIGRDNFNKLTLTVKHDDGTYSRYLHMNENEVKIGDKVKGGQRVGTSGEANGVPHLHFERWSQAPNHQGVGLMNPRQEFGWGNGEGKNKGVNIKGGTPVNPKNIKPSETEVAAKSDATKKVTPIEDVDRPHADSWPEIDAAKKKQEEAARTFASPVPLQAPITADAAPAPAPSVAPSTEQLNNQAIQEKAQPATPPAAHAPSEPPRNVTPNVTEAKSESKDQFFDNKSSQNGWAPSVMNYWKQGKEGINV